MNRRVFSSVIAELRAHPLVTLGFSLFWLWVWLVVQSSYLNAGLPFADIPETAKWVIPLAAYGGTFLLLGLLYMRTKIMPHQRGYLRALPLVTSFGVVTCSVFTYFPTTNAQLNLVLFVIGSVIMGSGTACIHMEWGRLLSRLGPRKTIIHGTAGTLIAMLLNLGLFWLPGGIVLIIMALLPVGIMALLMAASAQQGLTATADTPGEREQQLHVPWRFLITSFIQGSCFGILQAILPVASATGLTTIISVTGSLIGAVMVLLIVFLFRLDFNQLIYQVGFLLLALSFVLMAVPGLMLLGWEVNAIGFRFIDILMWALCVYLIKQRGLPTNWVFSITTCALLLGQVVGSLVGKLSEYLTNGSAGEMLSVYMVFVVLAVALLLSNKNNLQAGWGMFRPGDEATGEDDVKVQCAIAFDAHDLTARELEVVGQLVSGYSRKEISERLFLSPETVKTHVRNIFRKLDVHSAEELLAQYQRQATRDTPLARSHLRS